MRLNTKQVVRRLLFFVMILTLGTSGLGLVSAVECGSTPTNGCTISQNTTFNTGTYNFPDGVRMVSDGVSLNCSGATLVGNNVLNSKGIDLSSRDYSLVLECTVQNYQYGLFLTDNAGGAADPDSNKFFLNSLNHNTYGIYFERDGDHNIITGNSFQNNTYGILLGAHPSSDTIYNNISGNSFANSSTFDIALDHTDFNNIWNNTIRNRIIYGTTGNSQYVIEGIQNTYIDNATGPTAEGLYIYENLQINTNRTFIPGIYNLSNGVQITASGILFDCKNNITLRGTGSGRGIWVGPNADFSKIMNCNITNYSEGIYLTDNLGPLDPDFSLISNNTLVNNTRAIYFERDPESGLITLNTFANNGYAIYFSSAGGPRPSNNTIWFNNFINNDALDAGFNNSWNISTGGNYWSDYDSMGEGCSNTNSDLFCDNPRNITGSLGATKDYSPFVVRDGWFYGLHIEEIIPVQVIDNVDLVNQKRTLVRVSVRFLTLNLSDSISPNVTIYWNGTVIGSNTTFSLTSNQSKNIDFWYTPQIAGTVSVSATVTGMSNNATYQDSSSKTKAVFNTRNLTLAFVSVDGPTNYLDSSHDSIDFIERVYPIKDEGLVVNISGANIISGIEEGERVGEILNRIHKSTLISGRLPERTIGVVPQGWFEENLNAPENTRGVSRPGHAAILVEEDFDEFGDHVSSHELGHTYGLCDENSEITWTIQNNLIFNECPNGDNNDNGLLDVECSPTGCPTSTLQPLSRWPDNSSLYNMMGSGFTPQMWIAKDSYNHLLKEFNHSTPIFSQSRLVVSGTVNKSVGTIEFDNFYVLDSGLAENPNDHRTGNYSLQAFNTTGGLAYNISFDVYFFNLFDGGNTSESNESEFAFTIPYSSNYRSIIVKNNGITKDTRNISFGIPLASFISTPTNRTYSNEIIDLNWNGTDPDGDNLSYAVLLSSDNGITFTTLNFDINLTNYSINTLDLMDGEIYTLRLLVTDGVNTNFTDANTTFTVDNDLQIRDFSIVFQNNTERIFKISLNNTLNVPITNISWDLDVGESIKNSTHLIDLQSGEEMLFFIYHNYSTSSAYNVTFTVRSNDYIESEKIYVVL